MMVDIERFNTVIPTSEEALRRLVFLIEQAHAVRVAVFGKYNHGKSTLLNAIIGQEVFKAADKRETTEISEYSHEGIIWIDTPGLDADVHGEDDRKARKSAFTVADFLFLVHSVKTGELDKYETKLYRDLMKQDKNYRKKMFLILTQIDQLEEADLKAVIGKIKMQFPELTIMPVSATRYTRGVLENKSIFVEKSGMNELFDLIDKLDAEIESLRSLEKKRLIDKIKLELEEKKKAAISGLETINFRITKYHKDFNTDLTKYINSVQSRIIE
jgi:small GTP-binding protein